MREVIVLLAIGGRLAGRALDFRIKFRSVSCTCGLFTKRPLLLNCEGFLNIDLARPASHAYLARIWAAAAPSPFSAFGF